MELGIDGRIALVTGADSGIGWQTAQMLLAEGVKVMISDKDQDALDKSASELVAEPGQLHAFAADVTDTASVQELAVHTRKHSCPRSDEAAGDGSSCLPPRTQCNPTTTNCPTAQRKPVFSRWPRGSRVATHPRAYSSMPSHLPSSTRL